MRRQRHSSSSHPLQLQTHLRILAAHFARALLGRSTLLSRRAQGRPGAGWHPRSAARKVAQGNRTAAYRCSQSLGPSLRSGFTAYAVLSREPSSCWPPSPSRKSRTPRRLTRMPHPQRLDRSNDGQDHTVLPYARLACRHRFRRRCARCRRPDDETNLTAPLVGTKPRAHGEQSALPALSRPTLPRPPQARLYDHHDTWSPLKGEPGWATHTPKPNFGKAESFSRRGLTHPRHRSRNETPRAEATRGGAKHRPLAR
ncbi:hypothetical protein ACVWW2_006315 [Bradyrhizobium sp. LM4.3]